jgi:hypothetical protein
VHDFGGLSPKTGPLAGSLQAEWRRCGKPTCRCARGEPHGPYFYRYWRDGVRRCKRYVPRAQVPAVAAAIRLRRELAPPAWALRQELAELRRMEKGVLG